VVPRPRWRSVTTSSTYLAQLRRKLEPNPYEPRHLITEGRVQKTRLWHFHSVGFQPLGCLQLGVLSRLTTRTDRLRSRS
jgi:hypothetical protein